MPFGGQSDLVAAVQAYADAKRNGDKIADVLAQDNIPGIDGGLSTLQKDILTTLDAQARSPRRLMDILARYAAAIDHAGNPRQASLFGDAKPEKAMLWKLASGYNAEPATLATNRPPYILLANTSSDAILSSDEYAYPYRNPRVALELVKGSIQRRVSAAGSGESGQVAAAQPADVGIPRLALESLEKGLAQFTDGKDRGGDEHQVYLDHPGTCRWSSKAVPPNRQCLPHAGPACARRCQTGRARSGSHRALAQEKHRARLMPY